MLESARSNLGLPAIDTVRALRLSPGKAPDTGGMPADGVSSLEGGRRPDADATGEQDAQGTRLPTTAVLGWLLKLPLWRPGRVRRSVY